MAASGTGCGTDLGPSDPTVEHADVVSQGNLYRDDGSARGRLIAGLFPVEYLVEKRVVGRVESR